QIPLSRMVWTGTVSGLFGFSFASVRPSSQALTAPIRASPARALVQRLVLIIVVSSRLRAHADGEPDAARRRNLAVLVALHVAGFAGRLGIHVRVLVGRPEGQVASDQGER